MVEVVVGRLGRPHGVRGEIAVQLRTDEPERRFVPGAALRTDRPLRPVLTVTAVRPHGPRLLLTFAEVSDRTGAEALRGALLCADVDEAERPAGPDEFYDRQLVGLTAVSAGGRKVGVVAQVVHLPAHDLLAITAEAGNELLVPFVAQLVPEVDLSSRRVVLADLQGLLEPQPDEI
ncbi:MAG TPA: ribosome maturation factor RimM [Nocardioidaceae bacterium]|nr:ribosome maturation factor RimM [Nocardioidaceae bacterium]